VAVATMMVRMMVLGQGLRTLQRHCLTHCSTGGILNEDDEWRCDENRSRRISYHDAWEQTKHQWYARGCIAIVTLHQSLETWRPCSWPSCLR
jgi:hypothetical protein